jgi:hypothetical protein
MNLFTYESGGEQSQSEQVKQIDFTFQTENQKLVGIEVMSGNGEKTSGDEALKSGKIDYLIRVTDTFGHIGDNVSTIPIFAFDKLGLVLDKIESLPIAEMKAN